MNSSSASSPLSGVCICSVRIGQSEEGRDQERMRNALRIFQDDREGFDRPFRMTLRQIESAKEKAPLSPLRRVLRFGRAQKAIGPVQVAALDQQLGHA